MDAELSQIDHQSHGGGGGKLNADILNVSMHCFTLRLLLVLIFTSFFPFDVTAAVQFIVPLI